jgi:1-pyrroline-5-carboxylate dehydrogenase
MSNAIFNTPVAKNEPILSYAPGSAERKELQETVTKMKSTPVDVPMYINGKEVRTGNTVSMHPPYDHKHNLGQFHMGTKEHVQMAIDAALEAKESWANTSWEHRASVFLKAAELIAGPYRQKLNGATMLAQSKNAFQAEIDSACEIIDFFRYNAQFMRQIYTEQPESGPGVWNKLEYRPLEGFIFAITPFNFTAIAGNLPAAPAMMGNTVVWKAADSQIYSARVIMEILIEAGLPAGVINLVYVDGPEAGEVVFNHKDFSGLHFTGSTGVFQDLWKTIGNNIHKYRSYPRIVGETGGKDFIVAHASSNPIQVATAITRGAFEFQGQKCSAASRAYIPSSLWPAVKEQVIADVKSIKMGSPEDFTNFVNAVIDERAFDKISKFIDDAKASSDAEIIAGGGYDKSVGYFIEPTVIVAKDPKYTTMCDEIFGPVITIYVYDDNDFEATLDLVDDNAYALTGAIFAKDRLMIEHMCKRLVNAAGNFYINDKPTGAVVGQQPFGGARKSGTNDKAGAMQNLMRWVSARTMKETFVTPVDYRYPFLGE